MCVECGSWGTGCCWIVGNQKYLSNGIIDVREMKRREERNQTGRSTTLIWAGRLSCPCSSLSTAKPIITLAGYDIIDFRYQWTGKEQVWPVT
jgi:hypothetical protein